MIQKRYNVIEEETSLEIKFLKRHKEMRIQVKAFSLTKKKDNL